jgi:Methyltransferase domain
MSELAGHLDECTWEVARGWMRFADRPSERVQFDVLVDGDVVFAGVADQLGEDLLAAGVGDGRHRFSAALGDCEALRTGSIHEVTICEHTTQVVVFRQRLTRWNPKDLQNTPIVDVFAERYLSGVGLEIGALHRPQKLPQGARARHVDVLSTPELKQRYGEVPPDDIVDVEIIDDGATLGTVPDRSADFLIANNVLEHVENPVGTLANWHRVVRTGGIVLLVVPNPRNSIDSLRAHTTAEHVTADYLVGPHASRAGHYREWVETVERRPGSEVATRVAQLDAQNYPIHFHVWDELGCAELIRATATLTGQTFAVEHIALTDDRIDTVLVLRVT